jgi:hypothetical protein
VWVDSSFRRKGIGKLLYEVGCCALVFCVLVCLRWCLYSWNSHFFLFAGCV